MIVVIDNYDSFTYNLVQYLGELEAEVEELARRLAEKPALPLRLAKRAVRRSLDSSLEEMLDYELEAQTRCFESADAREGDDREQAVDQPERDQRGGEGQQVHRDQARPPISPRGRASSTRISSTKAKAYA